MDCDPLFIPTRWRSRDGRFEIWMNFTTKRYEVYDGCDHVKSVKDIGEAWAYCERIHNAGEGRAA